LAACYSSNVFSGLQREPICEPILVFLKSMHAVVRNDLRIKHKYFQVQLQCVVDWSTCHLTFLRWVQLTLSPMWLCHQLLKHYFDRHHHHQVHVYVLLVISHYHCISVILSPYCTIV